MNTDKVCFICGNRNWIDSSAHFLQCTTCRHETIKKNETQSFIINEVLSEEKIKGFDSLEKFKRQVVNTCMVKQDYLVDVGSGSGKFLYHNKAHFNKHLGIEVTEECIAFSKDQLELSIEKDISHLEEAPSVVTFWHSLEHIPSKHIETTLQTIASQASIDTRVIISVPSNDSLQYLILKEKYPYYDAFHHLHQFSVQSLDVLMDKYGFQKEGLFFSFAYSFFGYLQGFLNVFNRIQNYFYYRKKRGVGFYSSPLTHTLMDGYNILLMLIFFIPSLFLCLFDLLNKSRGAVLTICYKKKIR